MKYEDVRIKCKSCKRSFIFSKNEQEFYENHGFVPPKRCRHCRDKRKQNERRETNG